MQVGTKEITPAHAPALRGRADTMVWYAARNTPVRPTPPLQWTSSPRPWWGAASASPMVAALSS